MFSFEITHVFPGSDKQKAAGIYATFNLNINFDGEGTVVALKDLKLNRSQKDGKYYIGSPYREYEGKAEGGGTESKKVHFIKLWPDKTNWPKQDQIVQLVQAELTKNGNAKPTAAAAPTKMSAPKPVTKTASTLDDW